MKSNVMRSSERSSSLLERRGRTRPLLVKVTCLVLCTTKLPLKTFGRSTAVFSLSCSIFAEASTAKAPSDLPGASLCAPPTSSCPSTAAFFFRFLGTANARALGHGPSSRGASAPPSPSVPPSIEETEVATYSGNGLSEEEEEEEEEEEDA